MILELRWYVTCNKDGLKTKPVLQYQDNNSAADEWEDIKYVEEKDYLHQEEEG